MRHESVIKKEIRLLKRRLKELENNKKSDPEYPFAKKILISRLEELRINLDIEKNYMYKEVKI